MPTYDYRCSGCGHEFEKFQPISAAALKKCPACGKSALKRLIGTGAGIIFKGGGFYQTDYRSESYKAAAKKESEGAAPAEKAAAKEKASAGQTSSDAASGAGSASSSAEGASPSSNPRKKKSA